MEDVAHENDDEQARGFCYDLGLLRDVARIVDGAEGAQFSNRHSRHIRQITGPHYTGCVVLVFKDGKIQQRGGIYKVSEYTIGPAD